MAKAKIQSGFTLIELLVIISIISLVATAAILMVNKKIQTAKVTRALADLKQIEKAIEVKRMEKNAVLGVVTGSYCSDCACRIAPGTDWGWSRESINRPGCINAMKNVFTKLGFTYHPKDPWGNTYLVDENEMEGGGCYNKDFIQAFSVGAIIVPYYLCE